MLHQEESPEKPQYMATSHFALPISHPFLAKLLRRHILFPSILKKLNPTMSIIPLAYIHIESDIRGVLNPLKHLRSSFFRN